MYAGDLFVDGDDRGRHLPRGDPLGSSADCNTGTGVVGGFLEAPPPALPWSAFQELAWPTVWETVEGTDAAAQAFNDSIEPAEVDNAAGVEWDQLREPTTGLAIGGEQSFTIVNRTSVPIRPADQPDQPDADTGSNRDDHRDGARTLRPTVRRQERALHDRGSQSAVGRGDAQQRRPGADLLRRAQRRHRHDTAVRRSRGHGHEDGRGPIRHGHSDVPAAAADAKQQLQSQEHQSQLRMARSRSRSCLPRPVRRRSKSPFRRRRSHGARRSPQDMAKPKGARRAARIKGKCRPTTTVSGKVSANGLAGVPLTLTVKPSSKVASLLKKGKTVHLTATLTYKSSLGGKPSVEVFHVTVKGKKPKGHGHGRHSQALRRASVQRDGAPLAPRLFSGERKRSERQRPLAPKPVPGRWRARPRPSGRIAAVHTMALMDDAMPQTSARSWLRCYRCWSQDLEVQVHYEGIHKIDPESGERAEAGRRAAGGGRAVP